MSSSHPHQLSQTLFKEEVIIHPETEEEESSERSIPEDVSYEASFEEDHTISADVSVEEQTPTQPKDVEAERTFTEDDVPEKQEEFVMVSNVQIEDKPIVEEFTIISKDEIPSLDLPKTASDDDKDVKPYSGGSTSSFEDEKPVVVDEELKYKTDEEVSISSEEIPEDEFEADVSVSSATSEEDIEEKEFEMLMPDVVPTSKEEKEEQIQTEKTQGKSPEKIKIEDISITEDSEKAKKEFEVIHDKSKKDKLVDESVSDKVIIPQEEQPEFLAQDITEQIDIPEKPVPTDDKFIGKIQDGDITVPEKPIQKELPVDIFGDEISKDRKPDIIEEHIDYKPDTGDIIDQFTISEIPEKESFVIPEEEMPPEVSFEDVIGEAQLDEQTGKDIEEVSFIKESIPDKPIQDREDVSFEFKMPTGSVPGVDTSAEFQLDEAEDQTGLDIQKEAVIPEDISSEDIEDEMIIYEDEEQPENIGFVTHTIDYLETVPEEDSFTSSQDASFSIEDQPEGPSGEDIAAEKVIMRAVIPDKDVEESFDITQVQY